MQYDLIVIGSGAGGLRAALQGAKLGKKVVIVEAYRRPGGGCVHNGTLPSKAFRESVYRWSLGSRGALGQELEVPEESSVSLSRPDMRRLVRRLHRVLDTEVALIREQLDRNGVTLIHGRGKIVSPHEVEILSDGAKSKVEGKFILIATGSRPAPIPQAPVDGHVVFDSNSILDLDRVPRSMAVLGAGVIGCEYASMFLMAGTHVYLLDRRPNILNSVDGEIVEHLVKRFEHFSMEMVLEADLKQVEVVESEGKSHARLHLEDGRQVDAEVVLTSQGRIGNTENLGLEALGISVDGRGLIQVNSKFQTQLPHIYAVGDVIGFPALASTSMEQGRIAVCQAFQVEGKLGAEMDPHYPYGIYTIPEISMIGLTEEQLRDQKVDFVVGKAAYREVARGQITGDRWGLLKMLVDRKTHRILGVHIIGDNAAELIHIGQAVMRLGGDLDYFVTSVFNYPTLAEAYKRAAYHALNQIVGPVVRAN